jgi:hypothetical protein
LDLLAEAVVHAYKDNPEQFYLNNPEYGREERMVKRLLERIEELYFNALAAGGWLKTTEAKRIYRQAVREATIELLSRLEEER